MEISKEEGREIIYEDHPEFLTVNQKIVDESRWSNRYRGIFKHVPSNEYYILYWSRGKTEQQDEQPFEYEEPELILAKKKETKIIKWIPVEGQIIKEGE